MRSISVDVDIDLDDYRDDFLEALTDDELIEECEERDLSIIKKKSKSFNEIDYKEVIRKMICDKEGLNYHTKDDLIIHELLELFK